MIIVWQCPLTDILISTELLQATPCMRKIRGWSELCKHHDFGTPGKSLCSLDTKSDVSLVTALISATCGDLCLHIYACFFS